jgi:hypothetical protein
MKIWKEEVMAWFKVLFQHLPGGAEGNHIKPQSGQLVAKLRFETGIFWIQNKSANHSATVFTEIQLFIWIDILSQYLKFLFSCKKGMASVKVQKFIF